MSQNQPLTSEENQCTDMLLVDHAQSSGQRLNVHVGRHILKQRGEHQPSYTDKYLDRKVIMRRMTIFTSDLSPNVRAFQWLHEGSVSRDPLLPEWRLQP